MKSRELSRDLPQHDRQRNSAAPARPFASPEVDIYEGQDEILLIADLPGVSGQGVTVSVEGSELIIEGRRAPGGEEPAGQAVVREGTFADFRRSFVLPHAVLPDGIRAEIERGVLRVHLPKAAAPKPRPIPIKAR